MSIKHQYRLVIIQKSHSMPSHPWMPQIILKLIPSDAFMKKCSSENFSFILHMVLKFLHFEFFQRSAKIAYCHCKQDFPNSGVK